MSADIGSEGSEEVNFEQLAKGYRIGKQLKPNPPPPIVTEEGSGSAANQSSILGRRREVPAFLKNATADSQERKTSVT